MILQYLGQLLGHAWDKRQQEASENAQPPEHPDFYGQIPRHLELKFSSLSS